MMATSRKMIYAALGLAGSAMLMAATPVAAQDALSAELAQMAKEARKQFPMRLAKDKMTAIDIKARGHRLTFYYRSDFTSKETGGVDAFRRYMQNLHDKGVCTNKRFQLLLNRGVDLRANFTTKDGKTFQTKISREALARCPG